MKFGLFTSLGGMTWSALQSLWQHLETTGWDAACVADHFMPNAPDPVQETLECWTALAGLQEAEQLIASVNRRYGWPEPYVRDMLLAGGTAQMQDKLGRLREVGIDQVLIPTFLPPWQQEALDRLITEVAPACR